MSKITVTTIAGATSGSDANKVKIEDGDTLEIVNGSQTINRTGNGVAQTIQNGGTTVGEIGVNSTDNMFLVSTNTGFKLLKDEAAIAPAQSGGSNHDNALDLGFSTVRWKDLYLSGGAYIGGAVAANHLDDYEEGTFTPSVGGNATYNSQIGKYVKIGRSVTIKLEMHINVLGTGSTSTVTGIPFAADTEAPLAMGKAQNTNGSYGDITARLSGVTLYYMTRQGNVTAAGTNTAIHANNFLIQVSGSYITGS